MQRTLTWLRERGYAPVRKVEHWNSFAHKRQDLWGFDVAAGDAVRGCLTLVQVTDDSHHAEHLTNLRSMAAPSVDDLKRLGLRLVQHTWGKHGARGKRKTWTLKETEL